MVLRSREGFRFGPDYSGREKNLLNGAFGEPEFEFALSSLRIAAAMGQIVIDGQSEIAANRSWGRIERIRRSHHRADGLGCVGAADRHGYDRSANQIVANVLEEWSFAMLGVVSFDCCAFSIDELEAADFESSGFDSTRDLTDQISGYATWLNQDECGFHSVYEFTL